MIKQTSGFTAHSVWLLVMGFAGRSAQVLAVTYCERLRGWANRKHCRLSCGIRICAQRHLGPIFVLVASHACHLNVNGELGVAKRGTNRPLGKVRKVFEDVSRLPRRQQEQIVRWVSAFVRQYEEERR